MKAPLRVLVVIVFAMLAGALVRSCQSGTVIDDDGARWMRCDGTVDCHESPCAAGKHCCGKNKCCNDTATTHT